MSFDLYFYKEKGRELPESEVGEYLNANLVEVDENGFQWLFENEDTGVYYTFELNDPEDDPEAIELYESFASFDNTRFSFSLNFIRPNFFGLEAFQFVERFMKDLGLFTLNPQSGIDSENPTIEDCKAYYENWSNTNIQFSSTHFDEFNLVHIPIEKSNNIWAYNSRLKEMQNFLGDDYFVPSLILAKQTDTGKIVTFSTWTEHIPNVFPSADYYAVNRKRKKLLRTRDETGLLSYATLMQTFGEYFEDFELGNCKIIHPENAAKVAAIFNSVVFDELLAGFFEPVDIESLTNAVRAEIQIEI